MKLWLHKYRTTTGRREYRFGIGHRLQGGCIPSRFALVIWFDYEPIFGRRWFRVYG